MPTDVEANHQQTLLDATREPAAASWQDDHRRLRHLPRAVQFVIAATAILGVTMAFVGHLVSSRIEHASAASAGEAAALYMEAFLEPYVQELAHSDSLSPESIAQIRRLMSSTSLKQHIVSIKIWGADGHVLYSTDPTEQLKHYHKTEIAQALRGEIVTSLSRLDDEDNTYERSLQVPLYETYAPLRQFDSGNVLAVGEFFERKHEISALQQEVWLVIGAATLGMIVLLFFIVRRGDLIIDRQQIALRRQMQEQEQLYHQNVALQEKITVANHEFSRVGELILRRLGADLHDGPAQLLTLILLRLDELGELQERHRQSHPHDDSDALETIRSAAQDALSEVRNLSQGLALPEINDLTLSEELRLVARRHEQRTNTLVHLSLEQLPEQLPPLYKICIYRFAEEALNNAFRHAAGKDQRLSASYRDGTLEVAVEDNGPGFTSLEPTPIGRGRSRLGLVGMRYRVESLGGLFKVESAPGQGTRVSALFRL
ncbi:histidine kinase [Pseudomonas sp. LS44]|uniref:sensor histidine kinase n=1 Tax=Pseudomonas sp. LS44 TaxID=1357074 RepID=UPI00215B2999|nr:ATP-binding protein [Pseudomonas sp. LS44]UVE18926.1 histidine kinase [Pseudomonas sp. LS44]